MANHIKGISTAVAKVHALPIKDSGNFISLEIKLPVSEAPAKAQALAMDIRKISLGKGGFLSSEITLISEVLESCLGKTLGPKNEMMDANRAKPAKIGYMSVGVNPRVSEPIKKALRAQSRANPAVPIDLENKKLPLALLLEFLVSMLVANNAVELTILEFV